MVRQFIQATVALMVVMAWSVAFGAERVYYVHNDHLGTPVAMTDESGVKVWEAEYLPFGEAVVDEDPDGDQVILENNLRFPGQYYDAETGLHYNYFRSYDPQTGRYLEADPIGIEGGTNHLYVYAGNSPLNWIDPLGLKVYRCCREVQVNAAVDATARVLLLEHCYIKTDTVTAGMGPAGGGPLPSSPVGSRTEIVDHAGQTSVCEEIPDVNEACVDQELTIGRDTGRWWPWNNCNTVVEDIFEQCR